VPQEGTGVELQRSVLLPYAAEDMFDLVEQAEHYPQFLPWCAGVTVFERSDEWVAARIDFAYLKLRFGVRTRNPKQRPLWLQVRLVEGPFKHFQADWTFTPLGALGCKVHFAVAYEIAESVFDSIAAPAVDLVSRKMVEAFVKRAEATLSPLGGPTTGAVFAPAQDERGRAVAG
jgi:ribosome-associated toxin RatA of RatAB toxin-antitoxin module